MSAAEAARLPARRASRPSPVARLDGTARYARHFGVPYDHILFELPSGERVLVNDTKPASEARPREMRTAFAFGVVRDAGLAYASMIADIERANGHGP